ncbi:MAG: EAL domain-containing protein [Novosphingobium sp.]
MSRHSSTHDAHSTIGSTEQATRDFVALGIAIACILLFVGIGGPVLASIVRSFHGVGVGPDKLAVSTLLINIALILFSWRRYRQLRAEVAERCKAEEQARRLAEIDPLTGCLNRRSIGPATDRLIADAFAQGEAVAFFMIDIDNFKQVNDFHGHNVGDRILQESAHRIAAQLPPRALLARIGGDEFACVVPFAPDHPGKIDQLARSLITSVARPMTVNDICNDVTASLGIARRDMPHGATSAAIDAQAMLHMADIAMYHAKKQGRNTHAWFEVTMASELRFRNELESGIRHGIPAGEFVPYYQQQIDIRTGKLTGFEMLARWNSSTLGQVGPDVFIPVAEEIGLISELSENLIQQALNDARTWDPQLTLSVNISPLQLRDPWFAQRLLKILVEANFPPQRLDIEITETCLHENIGAVRSLITSLKNQGIRVSLDDFGTGYSSLSQLRNLPFDQLKIDRSFVMTMQESEDSATIVETIAALGKGLGLPITVEGIENEDVLDRLRQFGEIKGQGYFYGRPQTGESTQALLRDMGLLAAPPAASPFAVHATPLPDTDTAPQTACG